MKRFSVVTYGPVCQPKLVLYKFGWDRFLFSVSIRYYLGLPSQFKFPNFSSILCQGFLFVLHDFWEKFRINYFFFFWWSFLLLMCKLSFCRFACSEASTERFPTTIRPAVERGADRHSAGPPVGHVCCEAQRYEGGRYRCSQGTVTSVDHCFLALCLPHLHKNTKSLFVFRLVRKLTTLLCFWTQ